MTRCPYCHDAVEACGRVCAACLARHHADCWDEGGRCATCGGEQGLVAESDPARRQSQWRWVCLLASVPTGAFAALAAYIWGFVFSVYVGKGFGLGELGEYAGLALSLPLVIASVLLPVLLLRLAYKGAAAPSLDPPGAVTRLWGSPASDPKREAKPGKPRRHAATRG